MYMQRSFGMPIIAVFRKLNEMLKYDALYLAFLFV